MDKTSNIIECPNCHSVFSLDEAQYASIAAQVRTAQFEKEVAAQVRTVKEQQEALQEKQLTAAESKYRLELAQKDQEIVRLQEQAKSLASAAETDKRLAVSEAVEAVKKENMELQVQIEQEKRSAETREHDLKEAHKRDVEMLNEQIGFYKDMKIRQSTKMLGESLEQHCMTVFRQHRDEFPNAYFDKDNEVVEGTKGDFVYRENTDDGLEILSIMFEMKNEADDTVRKHRNEDFLAKLDSDRRKKNCEYAVLVSTLEPNDEVYNEGIVSAWQYDKMFIIRPQFFLTVIRVLRKAALASIDARRELMLVRRENLDVQKFDETLIEFRDKFGKNCAYAQDHFEKTIKEINEAIRHLEKVRDELEATGKQLNLANTKAQELTIKKLTKGNIGMQQKFLDAGIPIE